MVILRTRNKITDFFMILAWASPFKSMVEGRGSRDEGVEGVFEIPVEKGGG